MEQDPIIPSVNDNAPAGSVPPPLPAGESPVTLTSPLAGIGSLPTPKAVPQRSAGRQLLVVMLSLCLGLFLVDAVVSVADEALISFFEINVLRGIRGCTFLFTTLLAIIVYVLMGLTLMIPKRLFLPITLFGPVAGLLVIPLLIYFYSRAHQIALVLSMVQVLFGLGVLYRLQGGLSFHWPLAPESQLEARRFSWRNSLVFLLVNVFVVVPVVTLYLVFCASLGVNHFSGGFLAVRPGGLTVQVRKYVRDDGKIIQLYPMAHVGDTAFYRELSEAFPTNAIILMEGVSDDKNLLTNKISYKRMATSLGLAEQQQEFRPRGEVVRADVDVEEFTTNTIGFLNLVMLFHAKGPQADVVLKLMQYSPAPHFEEELFDDLLGKRNRHLLKEIDSQLLEAKHVIVPWGVAHMPEIAREIQKSGFHLDETQDHVVIRFGSGGNKGTETKAGRD